MKIVIIVRVLLTQNKRRVHVVCIERPEHRVLGCYFLDFLHDLHSSDVKRDFSLSASSDRVRKKKIGDKSE